MTDVNDAQSAPSESSRESLEDCEKALEEAKRESDGRWDALLRARAELENVRKRSEKRIEEAHRFATTQFVKALLPVKDSLELALAALQQPASSDGVARGVELTLAKLGSVFEDFGIATIDPQGEPFDPNLHEAISVETEPEAQCDGPEPQGDVVSRVYQKGYLLNGRLVRPAHVAVSRPGTEGQADASSTPA